MITNPEKARAWVIYIGRVSTYTDKHGSISKIGDPHPEFVETMTAPEPDVWQRLRELNTNAPLGKSYGCILAEYWEGETK